MKNCPSCGSESPEDSTFCESCGAGLGGAAPADVGACPSCGAASEAGSTFCDSCGVSLTGAQGAAAPGNGGGLQRFIDDLTFLKVFLAGLAFVGVIVLAVFFFGIGDSDDGNGSTNQAQATDQPQATESPQDTEQPPGGDGFPTVADAIADAMAFAGFVGDCNDAALDPGDLCFVQEAALDRNTFEYAVGDAFSEFYAIVVLEQLPDGTFAVNSVSDIDPIGGGDGSDLAGHLNSVYTDAFDDAAGEWNVGEEDEGVAFRERGLSFGSYTLNVEADTGWIAPETIEVSLGSEFYIAADVYMASGGPGDSCGIVVAASSTFPRLEFLVFDASGEFEVLFGEQDLTFLIDLTFSSAIVPNDDNRLAILINGSQATFIINGTIVGAASMPSMSAARVGVVTATAGASGFTACEFNRLEVRA